MCSRMIRRRELSGSLQTRGRIGGHVVGVFISRSSSLEQSSTSLFPPSGVCLWVEYLQ